MAWRDVPLDIQNQILDLFNKMLYDRTLFDDICRYYRSKDKDAATPEKIIEKIVEPKNIKLARWLAANRLVFNAQKVQNRRESGELFAFNKILISGVFPEDGKRAISGIDSIFLRSLEISTLKEAGYRLTGTYKFIPEHEFLEFEREN